MNEEKPFLGFSSFRAEPERKLSRRRFRLPARNFGIHGSRTTPDSLRPKTGEENHRILTNGSSSGNMPARTPCPKGKATIPSTFKGGGERSSPAGVFLRRRPGSTARPDIRCPAIIVMRHAFPVRRKQITRSSRAQSRFCKATANYS